VARKIAVALVGVILLVGVGVVFAVRSQFANDRIRSALETQASAALGEPVQIGTLGVRWFPRPGLTLDKVTVGASRTLTIEQLVLSTGLRPLLSGHIAEADVVVERSRLDGPRFFSLLTAPAVRKASSGSAAPALVIDAIRSISLHEVALVAGPRTIVVNADLAYAVNRLDIHRLEARSDITQLVASGAITDLTRRVGRLTIKAASLDLDGLIEFVAPFASGSSTTSSTAPSTPGGPLDVTAEISAKAGRAVGAAFNDLSATCHVTNGRVTLDALHFLLFAGRFDGAVAVRTDAAEPHYDWHGAFSGIDVARMVEFAGGPGTITGTLQARGSLRGAGSSVHTAFTTAAGTLQVVVRDGRIPGLQIVRTVILAFGRPAGEAPAGSGEHFSQLAADLNVAGGRATTRNLTLASRDFDMRGAGWLDLSTQALSLNADLILSRELSAQAGRDLYRYASEGDRIVLPAFVTGTAAHPNVSINVADALMRAARNKLKERMNSLLKGIIR
jgi:uncharacterized protein involved in outer membrane biogenesis